MTFAYYRELLMNGVLTAFASVIVVFCALVIRKIVKDSLAAYGR